METMKYIVFNIHKGFKKTLVSAVFQRINVRFRPQDDNNVVQQNREIICNELEISPENLCSVNQVHGDKILIIDNNNSSKEPDGYDAIITNQKNKYLIIQIADCQAVMLYDAKNEAIANIHNGWKGSTLNIVEKTIHKMGEEFGSNPIDIYVAISPSLGPCHAEFSDPYNELPNDLHKYIGSNNHVDFWQATIDQCTNCGIPENQIECAKICTYCNNQTYFSYRADKGGTGRFAAIIGMPT